MVHVLPGTPALRARLDRATADLDPPLAIVDLAALDANAEALAEAAAGGAPTDSPGAHGNTAAAGKPLRVASKSVRCRILLERVLARPGWRGVLAYTLGEAIWLVRRGVTNDAVVGYPTVERGALAELAADADLAAAITLMIDDPTQLDLVDAVTPPDRRPELRVCLDLDASWRPAWRLHVGVRRSPLHAPTQVGALAAQVTRRRGFRLVGLMGYEAQIAGVGDSPPGRTLRGALLRTAQQQSYVELLGRRGRAVAAAREHAELEFVNGGGTGSVAATAADPAVTELTAGSGLFGPTLFDAYRAWHPAPAALFALPIVRRPAPGYVTVAFGGWVASGPSGPDRLPSPYLPAGLRLLRTEGAGEVQTPLRGAAADELRIGDRVWFRHAKAGELCAHVPLLYLIDGETVTSAAATYRGEGLPW